MNHDACTPGRANSSTPAAPPLTLDWTPLLSPTGAFLHGYLRDLDAHQRALRPSLLLATELLRATLQARMGLAEPWQLAGPLYLLTVVGLRARPPWVPPSDDSPPPCLDWALLDRLLTALLPAHDPTHVDHADTLTAVWTLAQGGILQHGDPAQRFYADGAWPDLLPRLIADARWVRLFTELHGAAALLTYRRQAWAWVAQARRERPRTDDGRGGPQGGAPEGGSNASGGPSAPSSAAAGATAATAAVDVPAHVSSPPVATVSPIYRPDVASGTPPKRRLCGTRFVAIWHVLPLG